jgi:hypothetical protein
MVCPGDRVRRVRAIACTCALDLDGSRLPLLAGCTICFNAAHVLAQMTNRPRPRRCPKPRRKFWSSPQAAALHLRRLRTKRAAIQSGADGLGVQRGGTVPSGGRANVPAAASGLTVTTVTTGTAAPDEATKPETIGIVGMTAVTGATTGGVREAGKGVIGGVREAGRGLIGAEKVGGRPGATGAGTVETDGGHGHAVAIGDKSYISTCFVLCPHASEQ